MSETLSDVLNKSIGKHISLEKISKRTKLPINVVNSRITHIITETKNTYIQRLKVNKVKFILVYEPITDERLIKKLNRTPKGSKKITNKQKKLVTILDENLNEPLDEALNGTCDTIQNIEQHLKNMATRLISMESLLERLLKVWV